jgi:hypothetical protein
MMEAVRTSEVSFYSNETTWCHIPEGSDLHTQCHENLNAHKVSDVTDTNIQTDVSEIA